MNATAVEDLIIREDFEGKQRVGGVVTNWTLVALNFVVAFVSAFLNPWSGKWCRDHLDDGTEVRVWRSFIGFRKYERHQDPLYELPGGYGKRRDGRRLEEALWVI